MRTRKRSGPQIRTFPSKVTRGLHPTPPSNPGLARRSHGVRQDPQCPQKRLPFKSAPATWLEALRASGGDAESEWKALPSSEQRAIKTVADAAAKNQDNVSTNWKPRFPMAQPSRCRKQWHRAQQQSQPRNVAQFLVCGRASSLMQIRCHVNLL